MRHEDYSLRVARATIHARNGRLDEALALLHPDDKARMNTMRGIVRQRMENPPPMTHEETTRALESEPAASSHADGVAGDSAPTGTGIPLETVQGDYGESLPSKWCYNCNQYSTFVDECDTCHGDVADPPAPGEVTIFETCPCGRKADLVMSKSREARCLPCFFDEKMTLPCFQCRTHVTEILVRAIGTNGQKDFVGVCLSCLEKHVSAQNN